ncbi:Coenzyme PQQ biosynthesis protein A [Methylophilaceae bacterium]
MNNNRAFVGRLVIMAKHEQGISSGSNTKFWRMIMWTTPAATEMRFGFEVTMYVMNK